MRCHSRFYPSAFLSVARTTLRAAAAAVLVGINRKAEKIRSPPGILRVPARSNWVVRLFQRVCVESFLDLGCRISSSTGDDRELGCLSDQTPLMQTVLCPVCIIGVWSICSIGNM